MKIGGIQKVSLIDYPEKIACVIFLNNCNFRCGFCHNPELITEPLKEIISKKDVFDYLIERKKYLGGVCITGGEPLITIDKDFLKEIKDLGYSIKIDTNGSFPEKLDELIDEKLVDFVAMDIKSSKEKYEETAGVEVDMDKIEKSVEIISSRRINYELRTTIIEGLHDKEEIKKMLEWICGLIGYKIKKFVMQGFKNNGKFVNPEFKNKKEITREYLEELEKVAKDFAEEVEIRV